MLADKIFSVRMAIAELAGRVSKEDWERLRLAQAELADAEEQADALEKAPLCMAAGVCESGQPSLASLNFAE